MIALEPFVALVSFVVNAFSISDIGGRRGRRGWLGNEKLENRKFDHQRHFRGTRVATEVSVLLGVAMKAFSGKLQFC